MGMAEGTMVTDCWMAGWRSQVNGVGVVIGRAAGEGTGSWWDGTWLGRWRTLMPAEAGG